MLLSGVRSRGQARTRNRERPFRKEPGGFERVSALRFVRELWVGTASAPLFLGLYHYIFLVRQPGGDFGIFWSAWIIACSLPASALVLQVWPLFEPILAAIPSKNAWYFYQWLFCFSAGYFQWFLFLPWVRQRTDCAASRVFKVKNIPSKAIAHGSCQSQVVRILRETWVALGSAPLFLVLFGDAKDFASDLLVSLSILSFPCGWVIAKVVEPLRNLLNSSRNDLPEFSWHLIFAVQWLATFVAGYWQWFIFLPRRWQVRFRETT